MLVQIKVLRVPPSQWQTPLLQHIHFYKYRAPDVLLRKFFLPWRANRITGWFASPMVSFLWRNCYEDDWFIVTVSTLHTPDPTEESIFLEICDLSKCRVYIGTSVKCIMPILWWLIEDATAWFQGFSVWRGNMASGIWARKTLSALGRHRVGQ